MPWRRPLKGALDLYGSRVGYWLRLTSPVLLFGALARVGDVYMGGRDTAGIGLPEGALYGLFVMSRVLEPVGFLVVVVVSAALVVALGHQIGGRELSSRQALAVVSRRVLGCAGVLIVLGAASFAVAIAAIVLQGLAASSLPLDLSGSEARRVGAAARWALVTLVGARLAFAMPSVLLTPRSWNDAIEHSLSLTSGRTLRLWLIYALLIQPVALAETVYELAATEGSMTTVAYSAHPLAGLAFAVATYLYLPLSSAILVLIWFGLRLEGEGLEEADITEEMDAARLPDRWRGPSSEPETGPGQGREPSRRLARSRSHRRRYPE